MFIVYEEGAISLDERRTVSDLFNDTTLCLPREKT